MNRSTLLATLLGSAAALSAQQPATPPPTLRETIVVTGDAAPIALGESPRVVHAIPTEGHPFLVESAQDYLRLDSSVFISQRGAGGGQADISLRGSTFEQTLVLLNGLRLNDAQTSHHNLDLPIPVEALRGTEVLHGSGSTLYGADALGGVVNFLTAVPTADTLRLTSGFGSFGENEQSLQATAAGKQWSEALTGTHNLSTGFIADRDYRNETASSESRFKSAPGITDILLAASDRSFGAAQFYGNYPSWERTKGWLATAQQQIGAHTSAAFGYRRHADNFILFRNQPAIYANNHIDTGWQAALRRSDALHKNATLYYGLEADGESIQSNNLGHHARNRGAGYVSLDFRPTSRWSISTGLRAEILSGGAQQVWSPSFAASYATTKILRLRASAGYGFRLPTYTDLYYSDPTTIGNPNLKPESAWSADAGADAFLGNNAIASLTVFYSRQHNAIDYIRANSASPWQASNLSGFTFIGVESSLDWRITAQQSLRLDWTGITGAQSALNGQQSEYVFNYPTNNASLEWRDTLHHAWLLRTRLGITQRYQTTAYPVWDISAARTTGRLQPYLRIANLSNTGYQEIANVPMPGRSFTGGLTFFFQRTH